MCLLKKRNPTFEYRRKIKLITIESFLKIKGYRKDV